MRVCFKDCPPSYSKAEIAKEVMELIKKQPSEMCERLLRPIYPSEIESLVHIIAAAETLQKIREKISELWPDCDLQIKGEVHAIGDTVLMLGSSFGLYQKVDKQIVLNIECDYPDMSRFKIKDIVNQVSKKACAEFMKKIKPSKDPKAFVVRIPDSKYTRCKMLFNVVYGYS